MKLNDMLKSMNYISFNGDADFDITSVEYDSRKVKKGSLFVCVKGFISDGHTYINQAKTNGASAVVIQGEADTFGLATIKVENSRKALAEAACVFNQHPSKKLKIIGITGTNGKTTVTYLVKSILEMSGKKVGLIGTNEIMLGNEVLVSERTTPEAPELQGIFSKMLENGIEYCVMEVSSHSLQLYRVFGTRFEIGVFTNLTHEHLDLHGTMENYLAVKSLLFKMSRIGVLNADDNSYKEMVKGSCCERVYTYAINEDADITASNLRLSDKGVIFNISSPFGKGEIKLGIPGMFSVYNALSAIGACMSLGIKLDDITKGLRIAKGAKGRFEVVPVSADFRVIIDYAHTPDGLYNILTAIKGFATGKIILVFGCPGDRDASKRAPMGKIAGELSDYCVLTSDNPANENLQTILDQAEEGLKQSNCDYVVIDDRALAIKHALSVAKSGDVVLLAGKGHENYQIVGNNKLSFSEKDVVKEYFSVQ